MLRKIRIILSLFFFVIITLLFLDFTGTVARWFQWMARVQFLPALLSLQFGILTALVVLTLVFGRIYCSVICPLGVFQDGVAWLHNRKTNSAARPPIIQNGPLAHAQAAAREYTMTASPAHTAAIRLALC